MSQTIAIILRFREEQAKLFEELFKAEVYPLWQQFKAQGKFITASLTPVQDGSEMKEGVSDYILHVEVPGMSQHSEFDSLPPFLTFLEKARPMQPEEPKVWFGDTLFQV
jgi:hypothetical protein